MSEAQMVKQNFHFKTEKIRNEKNEVIGEGKKHPSVELDLPVPTLDALAEFISDPAKYAKEVELLLSTLTDQVYRIARQQINDFRDKQENKDATVTASVLDYDKLSWSAIANMPKAERASSVPGDEDIKAFLTMYADIMPAAMSKNKEQIENHVLCFQTGFKKQRSQKEILEFFKQAIAIFAATAGEEAVGEHLEVIEYFSNRLDKMLQAEEKITLDSL